MSKKKKILFIPHNHIDPVWRRCFDRTVKKYGVTIRSYAEVEARIIDAWLELAPEGITHDEGQAAVWRKYLERNPERLDELKEHAKTGRLNVVMAGETVQDSNMPAAEGLVRNFLVAMPLYRELVGEDHPGLKLAWLEDAFGNSPNLPQILKGVGAEIACRTGYRQCPDTVWIGIDETRIYCMDHIPQASGGPWTYHPPCPKCKGEGCDSCDDSGLLLTGFSESSIRGVLDAALEKDEDRVVAVVSAEEALPSRELLEITAEFAREHADTVELEIVNFSDAYREFTDWLKVQAAARDDTPTVDLTPGMPGCMVTHIRLKQRIREIAYALIATEARHANSAWGDRKPEPLDLSNAWQKLTFGQFHDAITGTHIDSGYDELMDMLDEAESASALEAEPLPAAGDFKAISDFPATTSLGNFEITYDLTGILAIGPRGGGGEPIFDTERRRHRLRRPARIGELTLEMDFGDAWGMRVSHGESIAGNSSLILLGDHNQRIEKNGDALRWTGRFENIDEAVQKLSWTVTLRASTDGRRLDFSTGVHWDTHSRRLRAVVPLAADDNTASYEVPFGFLDRTFDQEKVNYDDFKINTQEFPTLHWLLKTLDDRRAVALLNKGLPCYRYNDGCIDISLVRSPERHAWTNMPIHYDFPDCDGLRDTGQHRFEYSLMPSWDGLNEGDLTREGYAYNMPEPIELPFSIEGDVVVTAWKTAEDGDGWILRLQEAGGVGTKVALSFGEERSVTQTDLLERAQGDAVSGESYETEIHKHGILTLRIR